MTENQEAFLESIIGSPQSMDGKQLLKALPEEKAAAVFFDPQYRGVLDHQKYGNEGQSRGARRSALEQMSEPVIKEFVALIGKTLRPSGHLFLWIDKFHLCQGVTSWFEQTSLQIVDLIVWEKKKIGMGYRTRSKCEFLMVLQKKPIRAKGVWTAHNIPNVWEEGADTTVHPHAKPVELQTALISAVTQEGDIIVDPAMGGGSVFEACKKAGRKFVGGDINADGPHSKLEP